MKRSLAMVLTLLGVWTCSVYAQAPRTMKAVPLFPGATVDAVILAQDKQLFDETTSEMSGLANRELKVLVTTAPPDEVVRWYVAKLKAEANNGEGFDPEILAQGGTSPVQYDPSYYRPEDFENQYERDLLIRDGEWVKKSLINRARSADGRILSDAVFIWEFINANDGRSEFSLSVEDISFDFEHKRYAQKSKITIQFLEFSEEGMDEDE
ncbi:MAG TPA: hypothetical protein PLO28_13910 [bacterium]|nr:hypothetical protein [bacterium]